MKLQSVNLLTLNTYSICVFCNLQHNRQ